MKKLRFFAAFLTGILLFSACTANTTSAPTETPVATPTSVPTPTPTPVSFKDYQKYEVKDGIPVDKFDITYYFGPFDTEFTEEMVQLIADCGFTSVPVTIAWESDYNNDYTARLKALNLLKKYGLTCSELGILYNDVRYEAKDFDATAFENKFKGVLDAIEGYDNVKGWHLCDEPNVSQFEALGIANDIIKKYDPMRVSFINLFPTYASELQLGVETYEEYLEQFIKIAHPTSICFDNYHIYTVLSDRTDIFSNLELVRKAALANNLPYENIILLTHHYGYDNLTRTQISFEVCNSLLYGVKSISYFTFSLSDYLINVEGWDNSCINYLGEKYEHYDDVKAVNLWALPLGTELFNKTSTAVFHIGSVEDDCEEYTSYGKLGKAMTVNGEFVIGFFDDDSFMITNKEFKDGEKSNTLLLSDLTSEKNIEFFDTVTATWQPISECENMSITKSGFYSLSLNQGSFIYMRVAE